MQEVKCYGGGDMGVSQPLPTNIFEIARKLIKKSTSFSYACKQEKKGRS